MQSSHDVYQMQQLPSQLGRFWVEFKKNMPAVFALWSFMALLCITFAASWLTPFDPEFQTGEALLPPSWDHLGRVEYFLGTDEFSRDILSRLIAGSQFTFGYALLIAFSAGFVGIIIGMIAGISKGLIASTLNHVLDAALSIPSLLLAIIFVAFYGVGEEQVLIALWLALVPKFIRTTYTAVTEEMRKEYILSARLDGANNFYLLYHAILPNIVADLASTLTRGISSTTLDIAALGFLGLSSQLSTPEWGNMFSESMAFVLISPWSVILPCITIMFTVLIINLIGDGITQAINAGTE